MKLALARGMHTGRRRPRSSCLAGAGTGLPVCCQAGHVWSQRQGSCASEPVALPPHHYSVALALCVPPALQQKRQACGLSPVSGAGGAQALATAPCLARLDLSGNLLEDDKARLLASGLARARVTHLCLAHNRARRTAAGHCMRCRQGVRLA